MSEFYTMLFEGILILGISIGVCFLIATVIGRSIARKNAMTMDEYFVFLAIWRRRFFILQLIFGPIWGCLIGYLWYGGPKRANQKKFQELYKKHKKKIKRRA